MWNRLVPVAALALALSANPVAGVAQEAAPGLPVETLREVLINGYEQHRAMDTAYVRAVPDSALRWSYSPDVRDYARQIQHIAIDFTNFIARGVAGEEPPSLGDTAVYLNDKDELVGAVNESYDYVLDLLQGMSADEFLETTELFGQQMGKWHVFVFGLQHADWTRGQLVPYLRMNGVEPPSWRPY